MPNELKSKLTFAARIIAAVGGLGVGFVAFYLAFVGRLSDQFLKYTLQHIEWAAYLLPAFCLVLISVLRVRFFGGTEGTGIPQTIAALEMKTEGERKEMLSIKILLGKLFLTTIGLFSGASLGREGPTVHAGACLMYLCRKVTRFPKYFVQRGLILAGGAAGIAAAFNAPVAGIIFSFEEIGRSFDKRNLGIVVVCVLGACAVCIGLFGDYWFYGSFQVALHEWPVWIFVPFIGLSMGALGGLFSLLIIRSYPSATRQILKHPIFAPLIIGLTIGLIGWLSQGQTLGTGFGEAQMMLMKNKEMDWSYPILRPAATALTLLSGIPGGLFDPTLSAGASFGQWFSSLIHQFDWASEVDSRLIMMIAMACFFTGVVQSPITAVVIMIEMTDSVHATLPMLGGVVFAYAISRRIYPSSIYVSLASNYFSDSRGEAIRFEA